MINIDNLTKQYGHLTAVDSLNLNIPKGELFTFLGPNGAGKTTTIKVLTGLLKATSGEVTINGLDIQKDYVDAKKLIGYIPDHPYVYEKLTGREFIHFIADLYEIDPEERDAKMFHYLEAFEIADSVDVLTENYSHGMRQKLVFTAAFIHNPQVLIIDEPMVGLDPQSSRTLKNILKEQTAKGVTVFLSTHTLSVAEEVADKIGIIQHGKLIFHGTLEELRSRTTTQGNLEELFLELTNQKN